MLIFSNIYAKIQKFTDVRKGWYLMSQNFYKFSAFSLFLITRAIFSHSRSEQFLVTKYQYCQIPFILYRVVKTHPDKSWLFFQLGTLCKNSLRKLSMTHFFNFLRPSWILSSFTTNLSTQNCGRKKMVIFSIRNTMYMNFTLGGCKIP